MAVQIPSGFGMVQPSQPRSMLEVYLATKKGRQDAKMAAAQEARAAEEFQFKRNQEERAQNAETRAEGAASREEQEFEQKRFESFLKAAEPAIRDGNLEVVDELSARYGIREDGQNTTPEGLQQLQGMLPEQDVNLKEVYDPESPTGTVYATEQDALGKPSPKKAPLVDMGANLGKPPTGYEWKRTPDGKPVIGENGAPQLVPLEGGPADKPTERERTAGYAAKMMQNSDRAIQEVLDNPDFDPTSVMHLASRSNNAAASPEYQQYRAAADEWASNMVFLRSGATAREEEKTAAFRNYWPQPFDGEVTVEFKKKLRDKAMEEALALGDRAIKGEKTAEDPAKAKTFKRGDTEVSWDDIVETARKHQVSPEKVMEDLGIKESG